MRPHLRTLALVLAAIGLGPGASFAQIIRLDFPVADGPVSTTLVSGNVLYLGGNFEQLSPPTGSFVEIAAGSGSVTGRWPQVNGDVNAVAPDGAGGWYLGGNFTSVGGVPRARLTRILADGSVSAWNPGADAEVDALLLDGSVLYVGGYFANIGGVGRNRLASLDAASGTPTSWDPDIHLSTTASQSTVFALARGTSAIFVGGSFDRAGAVTRGNIASFDAATGNLDAWNPGAVGFVQALLVRGSTLYAGGSFSNIGGQARAGLAALDATTGAATAWNPNPYYPSVLALAASDSTIFIGGGFTFVGGEPRKSLAAVSATTGLVRPWAADTEVDGFVRSLAISGATLYVGGEFRTLGGQARRRLAALEAATGTVSAWNPLANNDVRTLSASGSSVFAGGTFTGVGGALRHWLGAVDLPSAAITAWDPLVGGDPSGGVQDLESLGSTLYLAGNFTSVGGQARASVAAVDKATSALSSWNPAPSGTVYDLAVGNGVVYAGGTFTGIGGAPRMRIAALDPVSAVATSWDPGASLTNNPLGTIVSTLAVGNGVVYAGGTFSVAGNQSRPGLAALDPVTGTATGWNPAPGAGSVSVVLPDAAAVYVGGNFASIGGQTRRGLAAVDPLTGAATAFDADLIDPNVGALALAGSTLYVGGYLTSVGGVTRHHLAAVDRTSGAVLPWNPGPEPINAELGGYGTANTLSLVGPDVYVGGGFKGIGGMAHSYLAGVVSANVSVSDPMPAFEVGAAQPNPFRSVTTISFSLPRSTRVTMRIYNVAGRLVATPAQDQTFDAGPHLLRFEAGGLPNGIYLYRMESEGIARSGRIALVR